MKKTFKNITYEEAVELASSVREEDVDTSDIPNLGGVTDWKRGKNRIDSAKRNAG
ncbi:MAG: hypothetical protein LBT23_09335 [Synergistaceae bacterium]|jgi:hypothetical protein|nr:hypothetical protein [Synergistaceae bacterium]